MHNLHFCVVRAKNAADAESEVESEILDWGDENNWRTICGSISEDGKIHDAKDGRWRPGKKDTIASLNKLIQNKIDNPMENCFGGDDSAAIKETLRDLADDKVIQDTHRLWQVEQYVKNLYAVQTSGCGVGGKFDILRHEFRDWDLSELGVTRIGDDIDTPLKGTKLFVVYVDMHS